MWRELHDNTRQHPKILKLAKRLQINPAHALGHMVSLWCWTMQMAPDGCLGDFDSEDIGIACQWGRDPEELIAAMRAVGLLEESTHGLQVHDWLEYFGSLHAAERKRKEREKKRLSRDCHVTVTNNIRRENIRAGSCGEGQGQELSVLGHCSSDANDPDQNSKNEDRQKQKTKNNVSRDCHVTVTRLSQNVTLTGQDRTGQDTLLLLCGNETERTVSTGKLNEAFEQSWHWSITPKAMPGYSALEPFSPAEIREAMQATLRACNGSGKPNPGLFLVKLKAAREGTTGPPRRGAETPEEREKRISVEMDRLLKGMPNARQ